MKFLVLAGTYDGRRVASCLKERGHSVVVSTLTEYGANLASNDGVDTRFGALDVEELSQILAKERFDALVDATHPYATKVKVIAKEACRIGNCLYFRWERKETQKFCNLDNNIRFTNDIPSAAKLASELGKRILLTTGSNNLEDWLAQDELKEKLIFIRVLPTSRILAKCEKLGFRPNQIVAAQGPFSQKWNEGILEQLSIDVVIAKESGLEGGTLEKAQACAKLGIPLILIKRPTNLDNVFSDVSENSSEKAIEVFINKVEEYYENWNYSSRSRE